MTRNHSHITDSIERTATTFGSVWLLHSFVTANPLVGFDDQPFHQAVAEAEYLFSGLGCPHPSVFRRTWENDRIDPDILTTELEVYGIDHPDTVAVVMDLPGSDSETGSTRHPKNIPRTSHPRRSMRDENLLHSKLVSMWQMETSAKLIYGTQAVMFTAGGIFLLYTSTSDVDNGYWLAIRQSVWLGVLLLDLGLFWWVLLLVQPDILSGTQ